MLFQIKIVYEDMYKKYFSSLFSDVRLCFDKIEKYMYVEIDPIEEISNYKTVILREWNR